MAEPEASSAAPARRGPLQLELLEPERPEARTVEELPDVMEVLNAPARRPPHLDRVLFRLHGLLEPSQARRIERRLLALSGVVEARVNDRLDRLHVSLIGRKHEQGFLVSLLEGYGVIATVPGEEQRRLALERATERRVLEITARRTLWLALPALAMGLVHDYALGLNLQLRAIALDIQAVLTVGLVMWAALPSIGRAIRRALAGRPTADLLPMVTGLGLFAASIVIFFTGGRPQFNAIVLAIGGAVWLEAMGSRLRDAARTPLRALRARLPEEAQVLQPGGPATVLADDVTVGDVVIVRESMIVPADGVALAGEAVLDGGRAFGTASRLQCIAGDKVWAGMRVESGALAVRTSREARASSVARISQLLEEVGQSQAWLGSRTRRFVRGVSVLAIMVAVAILVGRYIVDGTMGTLTHGAIHAALTALLAAAPLAAARLYDPTLLATIGVGVDRGILFRDTRAAEALAEVRAMVFDKTGTLTVGRPEVEGWVLAEDADRAQVLGLVLSLEGEDDHPVARALASFAKVGLEDVNLAPELGSREAQPGRGILAYTADGNEVRLGNRELMLEAGIALEDGPSTVTGDAVRGNPAVDSEDSTHTVVYLSVNRQVLARFHLYDPVRSGVRKDLERLVKMGIRLSVVTGDSERSARAVAEVAGIGQVTGGLSGEEMQGWLRAQRQRASGRVALVADGWQDAESRKAADVSVLFGTGMAVGALEDDVTILRAELTSLVEAVRLARRARTTARRAGLLLGLYSAIVWAVASMDLFEMALAPFAALLFSAIVGLYGLDEVYRHGREPGGG